MKKSVFSILIIFIMVTMLFISCKSAPGAETAPVETAHTEPVRTEPASTPQPAEPRPASPTPVQPDAAAMTRANQARQRAIDFESPEYFPSEWEAAEAQFRAAGNSAEYNAAAETYEEIFKKTVPLYAQAREDEIMEARGELIATGLPPYFPEYMKAADDLALEALDQYEAEDYEKARTTASEALQKYQDYMIAADIILTRDELIATGLTSEFPELFQEAEDLAFNALDQYEAEDYENARITAAEAQEKYDDYLFAARVYLAREELINRGFSRFDPENFDRADNVALSVIDEYEAGNKEAARELAEESMLRYNIVLSNGWVSFARERRGNAVSERNYALDERANIAARDTFRDGEEFLAQAEREFAAGNFTSAASHFIDAEAMFAIARQNTRDRRLRAEETIRAADLRIGSSDETAREAERIIVGGSR